MNLAIKKYAGLTLASMIFAASLAPVIAQTAAQPIGPNNVGATQGNLPIQGSNNEPTLNIADKGFRLTVCDGPPLPSNVPTPTNLGHAYVPCDFNGAMLQVQHLINIAMIAGVLVAILGFSYAGFLYITSGAKADQRTRANSIFRNVGIGFIIMLSAWFIVYQILSWLTGNSSFSALLGNP